MKKDYFTVDGNYVAIENGVQVLKQYPWRFKKSGVFFPYNFMHKFIDCRKGTIILFFYLCENMDQRNMIANNNLLLIGLNEQLKSMGRAEYKQGVIDTGIKELKQANLLISTPDRGIYFVNPRHACSPSITMRKKILGYLLRHINKDGWMKTNLIEAMGKVF